MSLSDIAALTAAIASGSQDPYYDVNGDGSVGLDDLVEAYILFLRLP